MIRLEEFNCDKLVQELISFFTYFVQVKFRHHQKRILSLGALFMVLQSEQLTFLIKSLRFKLKLLGLLFGSKAYHRYLEAIVNSVHSFLLKHLNPFCCLKYDLGLAVSQWFNLHFNYINTFIIPNWFVSQPYKAFGFFQFELLIEVPTGKFWLIELLIEQPKKTLVQYIDRFNFCF